MKQKLLSLILSAALLSNAGILPALAADGQPAATERQPAAADEQQPAALTIGSSQETACPECGGLNGAHLEGCPQYVAPPCSECGGLNGAHLESCPQYVAPAPQETVITGWQWADPEGMLVDGALALPGASEETPALFADITALLPAAITAQVEGGEERSEIELAGWACEGYPEQGAHEGSYTFTAQLPEGYALAEGAPALTVPVELGGAELMANAGSIDMSQPNKVFANGIPIVIKENGSITSVYDEGGNLLSGDTDVSSCAIYGGWFDDTNTHSGNTSVTMESGNVAKIYGGSYSGTLEGNTNVTLSGGTVSGWVYGGGDGGTVTGTATVTVNDGATVNKSIFGGGYNCTIKNTEVTCNGGTANWVYGGGDGGTVTKTTVMVNDGATVNVSIFGGGYNCEVSNTQVVCNGGTAGWVYGGGDGGTVTGTANVKLTGTTASYVYGGGYNCEVSNTQAVCDGGIATNIFGSGNGGVTQNARVTFNSGECTNLYGGSTQGTTQTAYVLVNGGLFQHIYGGGDGDTIEGTATVVINGGTAINAGNDEAVYGGGQESTVHATRVEVSGNYFPIYGGGISGTVGKAQVVLAPTYPGGGILYAGGPLGPSKTGDSEIIIQRGEANLLDATFYGSTADKSSITVKRNDAAVSGSKIPELYIHPIDIQNITAEYGNVTLLGEAHRKDELNLQSLSILSDATMRFQDWKTISIARLSGNGCIDLPAHFISGSFDILHTPVSVGEIPSDTRLLLTAESYGWQNIEDYVFFQGAAIDALGSPDCFLSTEYQVSIQKISGGGGQKGIYLVPFENDKTVIISRCDLKQTVCDYNGTLPISVGVAAQAATPIAMIPEAFLQIRGCAKNVVLAEIQINAAGDAAVITFPDGSSLQAVVENGAVTFGLPVRASLLDTASEGIKIVFPATDEYDSAEATLTDAKGQKAITIHPAAVTLTKKVTKPALGAPAESVLEEGPFYTASTVWHPVDGGSADTIGVNTEYSADIVLRPKPGHWLSAKTIESTVIYNGQARTCVFNADGSVTLKDVERCEIKSFHIRTAASPAEGGSVTGGGSYPEGARVSLQATPNAGWKFLRWEENGQAVSSAAKYTFTAGRNRSLTAVFEEEPEPSAEKESKTELGALDTVPEGLKNTFNTVDEIIEELARKVTVQAGYTQESFAAYDVQLLISLDGGKTWQAATEADFPEEGISVILPYPQGTGRDTHDFAVTHMFTLTSIRLGTTAGDTEQPPVEKTEAGLRVTFHGLSPVGIAWKETGIITTGSGNDGSPEQETDDEYSFWQQVKRQIEGAKADAVIRVNARGYRRMPLSVMKALRSREDVSLVIRWDGGKPITIPAGKALWEERRAYYPLSYLEGYDFGLPAAGGTASPDKTNPGTGAPDIIR